MQQLRGVKILQGFEDLIGDVAQMHALKNRLSDQRVQVRLHELKGEIQVLVVLCSDDSVKLDYVRVV